MKNKNKKEKQTKKEALIKKKQRSDGGVEVEFTKNPAKTVSGKIVIGLIIAGTVLVPIATVIWIMVTFLQNK